MEIKSSIYVQSNTPGMFRQLCFIFYLSAAGFTKDRLAAYYSAKSLRKENYNKGLQDRMGIMADIIAYWAAASSGLQGRECRMKINFQVTEVSDGSSESIRQKRADRISTCCRIFILRCCDFLLILFNHFPSLMFFLSLGNQQLPPLWRFWLRPLFPVSRQQAVNAG